MCISVYMFMYIHTYIYMSVYMYRPIGAGLEIGNVALQNANHFWDNCESLWQS